MTASARARGSPSAEPGIPIAATIVWGVLIGPGLMAALVSPMAFDAPGSSSNPVVWAIVAAVLSFPVLCGVAIAGSWIVWAVVRRAPSRGGVIMQAIFALLPAPHVIFLVIALLFQTLGTPAMPQMHETNYQ